VITVTETEKYVLLPLEFRDTPTGVDPARVVETGIQPTINTGIAHEEPGIGGAGLGRAHRSCLIAAMRSDCESAADGSTPTEVGK